MRTQEQFDKVIAEVRWFVDFHKKPVWLVPVEDGYRLSVIEPRGEELPKGTVAVLYGVDMQVQREVPAIDLEDTEHWQVAGSTVFKLRETGWRKGKPLTENEFSFQVQSQRRQDRSAEEALARKIALLLNAKEF